MRTKILSTMAAAVGSLCVAYVLLWQYEALNVVSVYPFAAAVLAFLHCQAATFCENIAH